jgi:type I restriction enzyme S subunit
MSNLPNNWQTVPFGEILDGGTRNGVYKPKKFHGTGIKIVNMGELFAHPRLYAVPMKRLELTTKELEKSSLEVGDLLFARRSLVAEGAGKCTLVCELDEPTTFESSIIRARPIQSVADSYYLYYFFDSPQGKYLLGTIRRQVAVAGITGTDLVELEIPLPPQSEQRAIAHILGTLDDKIECNRQMNATLEAMARAIFKSWFVDFDPVHAKAHGEQPGGMDAATAALFPDSFEDSELGPIPAGWRVKPLDEIAHYQNGLALQKFPPENEHEFLYRLKIRELRQGYFDDRSERSTLDIREDCIVYDGDVIFSWSGSLLIDLWTGGTGALNQHLFKVTSEIYPQWFYYFWTLHHLEEFQRIAEGKATTMGHIQRRHLSNAMTFVPPQETIESVTEILQPYLDAIINNRLQARTLAETRDALLPKLMSGEIRVGEDLND